ncbi:MAG TPA: ParB/RepB/Spo0J family partition protein [Candidatus Limnocylindrales bacterium]|nr:ParB/RepB/Spo0J family partition protein [Candidatus Limnocylindrales bacterium]
MEVPVDRVSSSPFQPRSRIDEHELEKLVESVRVHGIIQPILVTEVLDGYRLVAGERRLRAARLAGLEQIPAVVRQLADRDQLELALVENVQREDLNPLEEARAYRQLIDEFGFTQDQLAARVSRARSSVANTLRLLELTADVRSAIESGMVTEGHGRALAALDATGQTRLLEVVLARGLSVRQTEELARRLRAASSDQNSAAEVVPGDATAAKVDSLHADRERVEADLRTALGTKVSLARSRRGGRIVIEYYSDEELTRLYERLIGGAA